MSQINSITLNGTDYTIGAGGSGLTNDMKAALLQIASKVAYADDDGQDYYDALEAALYPPEGLASISAVYTQSGTVYDTDTLDDLKADLVVTATYEDTTTATITAYTLSGTLTTGTSTITVGYGGKSTTFTVTVTHDDTAEWDYIWKYEDGLPPASDWTWYTGGGSGQVNEIVSDGLKVTAKSGTQAGYFKSYATSEISSGGGGVVEATFYIPSNYAVGTTVSAIYHQIGISDGTNGVRIGFTHKKNNNDKLEVRLYDNSDLYSGTVIGSFSLNTSYTVRLEMNTTTSLGKVILNGTTLADNIDITSMYYATGLPMAYVSGSTVNNAGVGSIVQSYKLKYSPADE